MMKTINSEVSRHRNMVTGDLKPINNDSFFSLMKARYMMIHKRGSFNEKCIKRNKRGHIVKHEGTTKN